MIDETQPEAQSLSPPSAAEQRAARVVAAGESVAIEETRVVVS